VILSLPRLDEDASSEWIQIEPAWK